MFEIAVYWAERGRRVVYITPAPLERRPAACHDRSNPVVAALKLIRFIYLSDYEAFGEQLLKLHTYAAVPSVLLINDLDDYFNEETAGSDSSANIAKTCALIFHSVNLCSRVTKINVHVCAWITSIFNNNFLQTIYFRNIWNVTDEREEDGTMILLEKKSFVKSPTESYKYSKLEGGMRVLQQILYESEEA